MSITPEILLLSMAIGCGFFMAWGIGANDVSNAMGTSVGSKAITIKQAIVIAAIFEFLGAFLAGSEVTHTIKQNIINTDLFLKDPFIFIIGMLSALLASAIWLIVASLFGWPVSTTHTIVGAVIGIGIAYAGFNAIHWQQVSYIVASWLLSPLLGLVLSFALFSSTQILIFNHSDPISQAKKIIPYYSFLVAWVVTMITASKLYNVGIPLNLIQSALIATISGILLFIISKIIINRIKIDLDADKYFHFANVEKIFVILMLFTACAMAFAHGSNDVANAIGPVAAIASTISNPNSLIASEAPTTVPLWILILGAGGIVVGLAMYGHKVIATVGTRITQLTPSRGFAATLAAAITVVLASNTGLPISTTHTLVGGVLGVGIARGIAALNLNVIRNIFISWIVTLPIGAIVAVLCFKALKSLLI